MSFLDKLREARPGAVAPSAMHDPAFQKTCPALFEYMTAVSFSDGQTRTPCSLTVFAEDGAFKACLSERDMDLTLWGTGATFHEALACLETRLVSPNPDWRKKRPQRGKGKA